MTPFIPFLLMLGLGTLIAYVGARGRARESRHQRTLRHISQLERELGLQPDPTVEMFKTISRAQTQIIGSAYSFSPRGTPKEEVNLGPNVGVRLINVPAGQLPPK